LLALARRSATEHGVAEASSALKAQIPSTTLLAEGRPAVNPEEEEEYVLRRLLEGAAAAVVPAPRAVMSTSRSVRHSNACTTTLPSKRFARTDAAEEGDEGPLDADVGTLLLLLLPPLLLVMVAVVVVASRR
jgi:hypothetical protein